jgi:hypothetical protein
MRAAVTVLAETNIAARDVNPDTDAARSRRMVAKTRLRTAKVVTALTEDPSTVEAVMSAPQAAAIHTVAMSSQHMVAVNTSRHREMTEMTILMVDGTRTRMAAARTITSWPAGSFSISRRTLDDARSHDL